MDPRLKEIVDNFEKMKIGVDEPFKFHCTMCGKCCIHREDILLTPRDLYNMARELGISPEEAVRRYCDVYIGQDSKFPIVRLLPRGYDRCCPLLKEGKCSVHRVKPAICAMFPIGRVFRPAPGMTPWLDITEDQIEYIFTDPGCGDASETHTVREWLGELGILLADAFFVKWQQAVLELAQIFRDVVETLDEHMMGAVWFAAYAGLYLRYDMEQKFMPQFERNTRELLELMRQAPGYGESECHG